MTTDLVREFLVERGAHRYAHGRSSTLLQHLCATRDILRSWNLPSAVVDAGGLHSVYSTDSYRRTLVPVEDREQVRRAFGDRAERLAWLFGSISRDELFLRLGVADAAPDRLSLPSRRSEDGEPLVLARDDIRSLLAIYMANEAEQSQSPDGSPADWLTRVAQWAHWLREGSSQENVATPPILDQCRAVVSESAEAAGRVAWLRGLDEASRSLESAERSFGAAVERLPWVGEPHLGLSAVAWSKGDAERARSHARLALQILQGWHAAWDKRLPYERWLQAATTMANADKSRELEFPLPFPPPFQWMETLGGVGPRGSLVRGSNASEDLGRRRVGAYLTLLASNHKHPRMDLYPGISSKPWYDPAAFPIVRDLEAGFEAIRAEILAARREFQAESDGITRTGAWDILPLYERGRKNRSNGALCPATARIVEEHPSVVRTIAGAVHFSRLAPGTHIQAHRGITNLHVRCHLAIQVPEGDCAIRVGRESRRWEASRCMVFDDYYEHEAWNRTDQDRIVLIVDLWHPALTPHEIAVLEGLQRYALLHARDLHAYWSKNDAASAQAGEGLLF